MSVANLYESLIIHGIYEEDPPDPIEMLRDSSNWPTLKTPNMLKRPVALSNLIATSLGLIVFGFATTAANWLAGTLGVIEEVIVGPVALISMYAALKISLGPAAHLLELPRLSQRLRLKDTRFPAGCAVAPIFAVLAVANSGGFQIGLSIILVIYALLFWSLHRIQLLTGRGLPIAAPTPLALLKTLEPKIVPDFYQSLPSLGALAAHSRSATYGQAKVGLIVGDES